MQLKYLSRHTFSGFFWITVLERKERVKFRAFHSSSLTLGIRNTAKKAQNSFLILQVYWKASKPLSLAKIIRHI